jgi:CheY-like chemotaxis protein
MEKRKLILVADDSRTARQYLCSVIEKEGYETVQAENGQDALNKIVELKPSLIFLDLLMPELDGFDVLRSMKEKDITIPVIVLTADIQEEVREECLDLGASEFINKPFKENKLIETFHNIITATR